MTNLLKLIFLVNIYLQSLATHADYRGRGVAKELIRQFIRHVQRKWPHVQHIFLLTHISLIRYYQKLGFVIVGRSSVGLFGRLFNILL